MGWEDRDGRQYYYRKRRQGKQVVSEYVGSGLVGDLAAISDHEEKFKTDVQSAQLHVQKAEFASLAGEIRQAEEYTKAFTRAVLLLAGYHAPRRQWRKRRK